MKWQNGIIQLFELNSTGLLLLFSRSRVFRYSVVEGMKAGDIKSGAQKKFISPLTFPHATIFLLLHIN
jgi:hypothetical protein